jgi:curved DNA-binding protein CbpA
VGNRVVGFRSSDGACGLIRGREKGKMTRATKSHYEVLGVKKDATAEDVKKAYRRKARESHPDKGGDHDAMAAINQAADTLLDPQRRLLYDQTGQDQRKPFDDEVRNILLEAFNDALMREAPQCLDHAIRLIEKKKSDIQTQKSLAIDAKKKLTAKRKKIKTESSENVFHLLIDRKLEEINNGLARLEHLKAVYDAALKTLKGYESSEEAAKAKVMTMDFGAVSSATGNY